MGRPHTHRSTRMPARSQPRIMPAPHSEVPLHIALTHSAWAGNTSSIAPIPPLTPVHPRVGEEHPRASASPSVDDGSSPRGRGTPAQIGTTGDVFRFIPAWAGNTTAPSAASGGMPVHPRVGGEHIASSFDS